MRLESEPSGVHVNRTSLQTLMLRRCRLDGAYVTSANTTDSIPFSETGGPCKTGEADDGSPANWSEPSTST